MKKGAVARALEVREGASHARHETIYGVCPIPALSNIHSIVAQDGDGPIAVTAVVACHNSAPVEMHEREHQLWLDGTQDRAGTSMHAGPLQGCGHAVPLQAPACEGARTHLISSSMFVSSVSVVPMSMAAAGLYALTELSSKEQERKEMTSAVAKEQHHDLQQLWSHGTSPY